MRPDDQQLISASPSGLCGSSQFGHSQSATFIGCSPGHNSLVPSSPMRALTPVRTPPSPVRGVMHSLHATAVVGLARCEAGAVSGPHHTLADRRRGYYVFMLSITPHTRQAVEACATPRRPRRAAYTWNSKRSKRLIDYSDAGVLSSKAGFRLVEAPSAAALDPRERVLEAPLPDVIQL